MKKRYKQMLSEANSIITFESPSLSNPCAIPLKMIEYRNILHNADRDINYKHDEIFDLIRLFILGLYALILPLLFILTIVLIIATLSG